jgi:hypothetical protein
VTLRFLGKDPDSPVNGSPTLWDDGDTYVMQGWKITDPAALAQIGGIPDHETVIRFPKRMMQFFEERSGGERTGDV